MSPDYMSPDRQHRLALPRNDEDPYQIGPSGRELDALVAEKVMGIVWDESRCRVCGWTLDAGGVDGGRLPGNCSMRPRPERRADGPAPYSTSIAAAWLVVEQVCNRLGRDLGVEVKGNTHDGWWCKVYDTSPGGYVGSLGEKIPELNLPTIHAETAPLAICRAALQAVSPRASHGTP